MPFDHAVKRIMAYKWGGCAISGLNGSLFPGLIAILVALALPGCADHNVQAAESAARAQALFDQNRLAEARMAISEAILAQEDEPQYHILRGRIELTAGAMSNAFDAYNNARALDPQNIEALQAVAQLGLQTGHLRESLDATEALLSISPNDMVGLQAAGLHAAIRSRFDEAESYADRILEIDPASEGGTIMKARIAFEKGETQEALQVLDRFSAQHPATTPVALTRLEIYRALRNGDKLAEQFEILRDLEPDNPALRIDEANFAFKQGRKQDGFALTLAAIEGANLSREMIRSIIGLWAEYSVASVPQEAVRLVAEKASPPARSAVAEYLVRHGQSADAAMLAQGLGEPTRTAIQALMAQEAGRSDDANRLASQVLARDETHCLALEVRARAQLTVGEPRDGLRSAQLGAAQCPNTIEPWILAAEAYRELEDPQNARRIWRQGLEANPQSSILAADYVAWLLARGSDREAVAVGRRLTYDAPALMSGWRLYLATCRESGSGCASEAQAGLKDAATRYAIDLLPGERLPNGLFGRLAVR